MIRGEVCCISQIAYLIKVAMYDIAEGSHFEEDLPKVRTYLNREFKIGCRRTFQHSEVLQESCDGFFASSM